MLGPHALGMFWLRPIRQESAESLPLATISSRMLEQEISSLFCKRRADAIGDSTSSAGVVVCESAPSAACELVAWGDVGGAARRDLARWPGHDLCAPPLHGCQQKTPPPLLSGGDKNAYPAPTAAELAMSLCGGVGS